MNAPLSLTLAFLTMAVLSREGMAAEAPSLDKAPPVVVRTVPMAGSEEVDPALTELAVTYSKPMQDGSWSWSTWGEEYFPATTGKPRYLPDARTCVLPVKLEPGRFYALWLNSEKFRNFKDAHGLPAVPYLLTFRTAGGGPTAATVPGTEREAGAVASAPATVPDGSPYNADQRAVVEWTERQFRGFLDARTFEDWKESDRKELGKKCLDALRGPVTREYYQAINTLAALRATEALPELRRIALERRDKDNRDRWMSIRALGILGDQASVPELIHLVYHGNANTRWWAQISLVRLTGQNFGSDWLAWGRWWNDRGTAPAFQPEVVRWWPGQAGNNELAASLEGSDRKFLEGIRR